MTQKWTDTERETLFLTACKFMPQIKRYNVISSESKVILEIQEAIPWNTRDSSGLLYKMAEMGFLKTGPNTHKNKKFTVIPLKKHDLMSFKVTPKYAQDLIAEEFQVLLEIYQEKSSERQSMEEMLSYISEVTWLSETRVIYELFKVKKIRLNKFMKYEHTSSILNKKEDSKLSTKQISKDLKDKINALRSGVSYIYETHSKDNPSITYSNDGTGTGKSYSVINSFIEATNVNDIANGHRNLLFITPQKAQIDIDTDLVNKAKDQGIKIVSFLATGDLSNIWFKNWITGEENLTVFERWIEELKNTQFISSAIHHFMSSVSDAKYCHEQILKYKKRKDFDLVDELNERLKRSERRILNKLKELAEIILNRRLDGARKPIDDYFNDEVFTDKCVPENKASIYAEIIDFVLPFERAKRTPCIMLATSDKFMYNVYSTLETEDEITLTSSPFDYVIGQKRNPTDQENDSRTADKNSLEFEDQVDFIKNDYFITDESNYFRNHNISFTLIVDEEHIAYDKFFAAANNRLFDPEFKMAHIFSVIYRIYNHLTGATEENKDSYDLYDDHKKFCDTIDKLFLEKCDITEGVTLNQILKIFSDNLYDISIDSSEVEQILNICRNVFSITPKRFFNEQNLKKIRIRSTSEFNSSCRIYFEENGNDGNPTMHDVMQTLLCVFAACSQIKSKDFRNMLKEGEQNSQNSLIDKFIHKAVSTRVNLDAMFDRADNDELKITEFYTYFTPKMVFSIEKMEHRRFYSKSLKNKVFVNFRLDLFESLPEVTLMRVLHDTQNSVICLSATSGFKDSYSGNYARPVMELYGSDSRNNLDYRCISRTQEDAEKLQKLRELRGQARNVSIHEFLDTSNDKITNAHQNEDFREVYDHWFTVLRPHFNTQNKYTISEHKRQIEAMLLACYQEKNTLILSLSNNFSRAMRSYLSTTDTSRIRGLNMLEEDSQKIFEISPFDNGITLRVILFDAPLVKTVDIEDYLKLEDSQTKIAFISSYKSAGTGLNLFVHYQNEGIDEDFERLVLTNGPFYSNIKKQDGFNSIENYVLLLKHYAKESEYVQLKDFDVNLINGKNYQILMREHQMSILKDIMQAIGRVERRDTYLNTEIFLPMDIIEDVAMEFNHLKGEGNELIFQSMSLLNYKLMEHCNNVIEEHSFTNSQRRKSFEDDILEGYESIDHFFSSYLKRQRLEDARRGDMSAVELNEALRHIDCIKNPTRYIERILKLPEIAASEFLKHVVSNFYIQLDDEDRNVTLCTLKLGAKGLTDMSHGNAVYKPYERIIPSYHKSLSDRNSDSKGILTPIVNLKPDTRMIPHPEMIPLFKGNLGEYLFSECLKTMSVEWLSNHEVFALIDPVAYELFDFYVRIDNMVYCIDVKQWSISDKKDLAQNTYDKFKGKRAQVSSFIQSKGLTPCYIYVNCQHDLNGIHVHQESAIEGDVYFLNLFKRVGNYREVNDEKSPNRATLKESLNINNVIVSLLKGNIHE